jgi:hypothetical protein
MPNFIKVPVTEVVLGDTMVYAIGLSEKVKGVSSDADKHGCMSCNTPPGTTTIDIFLDGFIHPFIFYFYEGQAPQVEVYR